MERNTILLDLDGTLLPIDMDEFLESYFKIITAHFINDFDSDIFMKSLFSATDDMINNNGSSYNAEVFKNSFFNLVDVDDEKYIMDKFEKFYKEHFPGLKEEITIDRFAERLVKDLENKGYNLVIATNAVFPREAIEERLHWINLNPDDFIFITSYENMHYCKPNLDYYQEILDNIEVPAEKCIMVGNDRQEDMIAGELGIQTLLVTDFLIDRSEDSGIDVDWKGTREQLLEYFKK